ncbi:hypothetical protein AB0D98_05595 [Streptomyces sp. NPDC047987]|uniref:hypothetical protein n=1 Tax=unclassified Streptomyces TaxID=2593676 RepID=UPI003449E9E7
MTHPFRAGAAAVVLAAALVACGSSSSERETADATAGASASPAPGRGGPVAGPAATASQPPAPAPDKGRPRLPTAELTPATGSFTEKEKEYLTDRVPRGMDPAAVLQTGQETCDRLTFLVKADRDTAVGALLTGEIADAEPAVEHLCVRHRDLLREAARGYADGTHEDDGLRPGRYRGVSPTDSCAWRVTGAGGTVLASGSTTAGNPARITVPKTARAFTSTGCYAWLPEGGAG